MRKERWIPSTANTHYPLPITAYLSFFPFLVFVWLCAF